MRQLINLLINLMFFLILRRRRKHFVIMDIIQLLWFSIMGLKLENIQVNLYHLILIFAYFLILNFWHSFKILEIFYNGLKMNCKILKNKMAQQLCSLMSPIQISVTDSLEKDGMPLWIGTNTLSDGVCKLTTTCSLGKYKLPF